MATQDKMPPLTPYLTIKGAAAALEFYKKAFGAKENARLPAQDGKRLMHADITINGGRVLMSDWFEEYQMDGKVDAPSPSHLAPVAVALHFKKPAEVDAAYQRAMEAGCRNIQQPQDMFWEARFAMLSDPYGHRWMMNAPLPAKKPARSDKKKASA
jgi:PhnB protein